MVCIHTCVIIITMVGVVVVGRVRKGEVGSMVTVVARGVVVMVREGEGGLGDVGLEEMGWVA